MTRFVRKFAILGSRGYPSHYGGFETLVRYLAPYLAERGHEVTVYDRGTAAGPAPLPESAVPPSGPLHTDDAGSILVRTTRGIDRKSISTLSFGFTSSVDLAQRGCDAALVLNVANGFFLPRLQRAGIPTCVNVDGIEWCRGKWGTLGRKVFRMGAVRTARYADAVIADSVALRWAWKAEFGRDSTFIPYGAPVLDDVGTDQLRAAGLPLGGYVLVVARIVPENNVDILLDAIECMEERPEVIVVGGGNYQHATVDRLRRLAAEQHVRWLGQLSNQPLLDQLWAHAGVYWHGHSIGGTNPALLQALGAGAPTIALRTPFNAEVIRADRQLVDADPERVAVAIREVLTSSSLSEEFATHGQSVVRTHYDWSDVCGQYESLLLDLVGMRQFCRRRVLGGGGPREDRPSAPESDAPTAREPQQPASECSRPPSQLPPMTVVIVNYECAAMVADLVNGLPEWVSAVIVDNSVDSEEAARLREIRRTQIITASENRGFAAGVNLGAATVAPFSWLLLISPDVRIDCDALRRLWEGAIEAHLDISAPLITNSSTGTIWYAGGHIHKRTASPVREGHGQPITGHSADRRPHLTEFLPGCLMLLSPRAVRELLPMRDDLFMSFEDVDLCLKAREAGLRLGVVPDAIGDHRQHPSKSNMFYRYRMRNRLVVAKSSPLLGTLTSLVYTPAVLINEVCHILRSQQSRSAKIAAACLGALEGVLARDASDTQRCASSEARTPGVVQDAAPNTILVNPLCYSLAHYSEVLEDVLSSCGLATVTVWGRGTERVEQASAPRRIMNAIRFYAVAAQETRRHPQADVIVCWPLFGFADMVIWRVILPRSVRSRVVLHELHPLRRQLGSGRVTERVARGLVGKRAGVITHNEESRHELRMLGWRRVEYLPLPFGPPGPDRLRAAASTESSQTEQTTPPAGTTLIVAGSYKPARALSVLRDLAVRAPERGVTLVLIGAGWPELPGWLQRNDFVTEEEFSQAISRSTALLVPYERYEQSGVAFQAYELGVPVIGKCHEQLDHMYGKDHPGSLNELTAPEILRAVDAVCDLPRSHWIERARQTRQRDVAAWQRFLAADL